MNNPVEPSPPLLTVAICTHNRSGYLEMAIESLLNQTASQSAFQVLVVDNASTDATPQVVDRARALRADIQYVREDKLGLSIARNRAIQETQSSYIAFLDDDAIAAPVWVERLLHCFTGLAPRPAAVGGPIIPIWEAPRPSWLPDSLLGYLTILEKHPESTYLDLSKHLIFGANMTFERATLLEVGGFDASLGRIGSRLLSGEEMLLLRQLQRRGAVAYYDTQASVRHHVARGRLTKVWFYQRAYWDGISSALINIRLDRLSGVSRFAQALRELRSYLIRGQVWRSLPFVGSESTRFGCRCQTVRALSRALGYLRDHEAHS